MTLESLRVKEKMASDKSGLKYGKDLISAMSLSYGSGPISQVLCASLCYLENGVPMAPVMGLLLTLETEDCHCVAPGPWYTGFVTPLVSLVSPLSAINCLVLSHSL